jgi:hypothetical protein
MAHEYTIETPHGDATLTTEHHHSKFRTVEDFIAHHRDVIANALHVASTAILAGVSVYYGRGKINRVR